MISSKKHEVVAPTGALNPALRSTAPRHTQKNIFCVFRGCSALTLHGIARNSLPRGFNVVPLTIFYFHFGREIKENEGNMCQIKRLICFKQNTQGFLPMPAPPSHLPSANVHAGLQYTSYPRGEPLPSCVRKGLQGDKRPQ